jgi:Holliday junction resolvase RusA-like endonuclease
MMPSAVLTIPGKPIAKARPKFARRGKFVVTYSPQETEEGRVLWEIKNQWKQPPIENPITINFVFGLPMPKSTSKKNTDDMINGFIRASKKPDLDNYQKFYLDCMNETVFKDDAQVWKITAVKVYAKDPQTLIGLEW